MKRFFKLFGLAIIGMFSFFAAYMLASRPKIEPVRLYVNYCYSVTSAAEEGNYSYVSPLVNDYHFSENQQRPVEDTVDAYLIKFSPLRGKTSVQKALKWLDDRNLRPATVKELEAFGIQYPDIQRHCNIIALGSKSMTRYGTPYWPGLFGYDRPLDIPYLSAKKRSLSVFVPDPDLSGNIYVLAVKKNAINLLLPH